MTSRLTRYVARSVISGALLVLLALVSLDVLFAFFREIDELGRGDYTLWLATAHVLLTVPGSIYELFPSAVAIGGVLGLGALAANSELVVMRAAGISIRRIMGMVMQGGVLLMVLIIAVGEWVAPASQARAEQIRADAISGQGSARGESGLWVRDENRFIKVGRVLPGYVLRDVEIYEFDDTRLVSALHAERAVYEDPNWRVSNIRRTLLDDSTVSIERSESAVWERLVRPELFTLLSVSPESLPAWRLYRYVQYLHDNRLEAERFELALWKKLATPISTLVMLLLALPVVFGSTRAMGTGQRVFIGSLIGIGYYLIAELFSHIGVVYGLAPPLAALAPAIVFSLVALVLLRRV